MSKLLLFRCSRLGEIVTGNEGLTEIQTKKLADLKAKQESGKITENQLIELGTLLSKKGDTKSITKTTESYVKSLWLEREFGYREEVMTDEMMKGHICEQDSLQLVQDVIKGEFRKKNTQYLKNDFIHGTPDVILKKEDYVEDVKTSFNLRTFTESDLSKSYWWQAQGYMWLTGKKKYRLVYCLVKTPDQISASEKRRWYYKFDMDENNEHFLDACKQIDRNNDLIEEIPKHSRIKVFEFDFEPEKIELLKTKIEACREYYKTLSLPVYGEIKST